MFPLRTTQWPWHKLFGKLKGDGKRVLRSRLIKTSYFIERDTDGKLSILLSSGNFLFSTSSLRGEFFARGEKESQNFPHFRVDFRRFLFFRPSLSTSFSVAVHTLHNFESISCRINRRVSSISFSFLHPTLLPPRAIHTCTQTFRYTVTNCASSFFFLSRFLSLFLFILTAFIMFE